MLLESLGPLIYIAVISAALVGLAVALGRRERNPNMVIPRLKLKVILSRIAIVAVIVIIPVGLLAVLAFQNAGVVEQMPPSQGHERLRMQAR
jgi:hypothetical protein